MAPKQTRGPGGSSASAGQQLQDWVSQQETQETIRLLHSVQPAEDEFQDLAQEITQVRAVFAASILAYKKRYQDLLGTVSKLKEEDSIPRAIRIAAAVFRSMVSFVQLFTTEMAELFQTTVDILLHGIQRRVAHYHQIFKTTAAVVQE